ncbi:sensor histidine kinase [Paenibacillus physcomitrellae]|uniref:histidine kinase n=1 Tax=Paenibacillus physcomitrellae TaxID=1619311 RepID=A0ABQ1FST4_9BACL|nr:sensor histidine kinase [Paenibacillus physcomitrellae]GGA28098.1 sensor protein BceS [Paenibacillus physcomitrellae]
MIGKFLRERITWIAFVILQQALILFVAFVDAAIPFWPAAYIVFLSILAFLAFLVYRYFKEIRFYRSLQEWNTSLDKQGIQEPDSPFEQIIDASIAEQTERLREEVSRNQMLLESEKDDLLAWIHEVKTPLTAMHLMIERMEDAPMKANLTYEWLRIHLLLDQQLHSKRISFLENDLYIEKLNLKTLLVQEIRSLQSWCMQKGIGVELQLKAPEVYSDAKWLSFIFRQLLTNAIKYSESSDITIVSAMQEGQVVVEVQDEGRGIEAQDLPRIFDKGFTSTIRHGDQASTGMGLYLTRRAAEALSIRIQADSEPGRGTRMILIFSKRNEFVDMISM